jgi:hypothetical protein
MAQLAQESPGLVSGFAQSALRLLRLSVSAALTREHIDTAIEITEDRVMEIE